MQFQGVKLRRDKHNEMFMQELGGRKRKCRFCEREIWRFGTGDTRICAACEMWSTPLKGHGTQWEGVYD